jgi:hypothetical protein
VLLLLAILGAVPVWAAEQVIDGHRVRREEGMDGVPAKLLAPDGRQVASFDTLYADHYHPLEVRGGQVFWISRPRQLSPGWTDELKVTELAGGRTRTLYSKPGLDFRVDAQGRTAAVVGCNDEGACTLHRVDVASGRASEAHASDSMLYPLGLSRDGARVWFGKADGPAGEWMQLGLNEQGKTRFFPLQQDSNPAIDFDSGRVATTQRKKGASVLVVQDLLSSGRVEVASRKRGAFKPEWTAEGHLSYVDAQGRKARYTPAGAGSGAPDTRRPGTDGGT